MNWTAYLDRIECKENQLVHLISVGNVPAIPAGELKPGMLRRWNYGGASVITKVERQGEYVYITTAPDKGEPLVEAKYYTRKHKTITLVPVRMQNGTRAPQIVPILAPIR